jgi:hypothetical protein
LGSVWQDVPVRPLVRFLTKKLDMPVVCADGTLGTSLRGVTGKLDEE